jgi:hypothetical protein
MPDVHVKHSVTSRTLARPADESSGPPAAVPHTLRVEDLGMGMARLAVSQCLPLDVARRIAAILREGGVAPAGPSSREATRALDRTRRGRRPAACHPARYRGWTSGS